MSYSRCQLIAAVLALTCCSYAGSIQDTWSGVDRVVAVGDIHGDYERFIAVLRSAALIDENGEWIGGNAHLVQVGDLLDRGSDSRKCMDLLIKLEQQARAAGGYVHALIGNHEAMSMYGDFRYVSAADYESFRTENSGKLRDKAYKAFLGENANQRQDAAAAGADRDRWYSEHPLGYFERRAMFDRDGLYGKWIRSHNAIIKIDDTIFLHSGISAKYASYSIKKINERVREELGDVRKLPGGMVTDLDGPLWYRGLATGDESQLNALVTGILSANSAKRIVIGHTFTDGAITPRFNGSVLLIDIGLARLYDNLGRLACLVIEKGKPYALHRGAKLDLPTDSTTDMLRYLKQAAALDPTPSSLSGRIAKLESTLQ